ncbi:hypothetical protein BJV78DRAFT_1082449, partial [Lactifluus subvellereus]
SPSKRMHILYSQLGSTSRGSMLLSTPWLTSYNPMEPVLQTMPALPQPDWSLLDDPHPSSNQTQQESIRKQEALTESLRRTQHLILAHQQIQEGHTAQMIVQHLEVTKLTKSLEAKENQKKTDHAALFPYGQAVHFTDDKFTDKLLDSQARLEEQATAKEQRKSVREHKKATKEALEVEWKRICAAHDVTVAEWKAQCETLSAKGVSKKDLPVKPKRVLKSLLVVADEDDDEEDEDNEDE